jgi:hypothetical protein
MSVSCKRRSTSSILIPCKATCRQREFGRRTAVFLRCGDGGKGRLGCIVLLRYVVGYTFRRAPAHRWFSHRCAERRLPCHTQDEVGWISHRLSERTPLPRAPPEGLKEYVTQRSRWVLGFAQICSGPLGPLRRRNGLTPVDRISLIETFLYWSANYSFRLLGIIIPVVHWLFDVRAVHADGPARCPAICPALPHTGRDSGLDGARPYHAGDVRRDPVAGSHANRPGRGPWIVP